MWSILANNWGELSAGLLMSLKLTGVAFSAALVLGTVLAMCRISPIAPLRAVGLTYVEIFRNVPLMSLMLLLLYAMPGLGLRFGFEGSVLVGLSLVGSAFVCEALRSGINSVDGGQIEAARSIGLGFGGVLSQVVMPQAFRAMVQPLVSVLIGLFLSSSLAGVVGVVDLTLVVTQINNVQALGLIVFVVAALIYVAISLTFAWVGSQVERHARIAR